MILYHGTNQDFETVDLSKCKRGKDFGCGFYLSDNVQRSHGLFLQFKDL